MGSVREGESLVREDEVRRSEEKGKKGEGRMRDEVWLFWLENKQDFRSFIHAYFELFMDRQAVTYLLTYIFEFIR